MYRKMDNSHDGNVMEAGLSGQISSGRHSSPDKNNQPLASGKRKGRGLGFLCGILAAMFYGTNPLGSLPLYADGLNSVSVLFYRYAIAVAIFAVVMAVMRYPFRVKPGHLIRLAMLGAIFSLSSTCLYVSFLYMDAGVASTILFSYPIMVAVLMVVFFHERASWMTALSIALATAGIALLYQGDGQMRLSSTGLALVIISSLLYAIYIIAVQRWNQPYSSVTFTFWIVFFGLCTILLFSFFAREPVMMLHGMRQWACGFQLALLPTVLSLFLMNISIERIGSTPSAILGALEPVTAVVIGVMVFGESFTSRLAVGIALILSGVIIIIAKSGRSQRD